MRKVNATAVFERFEATMNRDTTIYRLKSVYVKINGEILPLFTEYWNVQDLSFKEMYDEVLALLRNNEFYVKRWDCFGTTWYDIDWIDKEYPYYPVHWSYKN